MSGSEAARELDRDIVGTCAFLATYLAGVPVESLWESGHDRDFAVIWLDARHSCVWDPKRYAYVHVEAEGDHWQLYDVGSGHHLRVDRRGSEFAFADDASPAWSVQVLVARNETHASGPDGEHCYGIGLSR